MLLKKKYLYFMLYTEKRFVVDDITIKLSKSY